jgi:YD repeat-containing protein
MVEKPSYTNANLIQTSTYNNKGQLQSEATMAGTTKILADKLYEYDELGNQFRAGADIDTSGGLTVLSTDRLSETNVVYEKSGNDWFRVTTNKTYLVNNSDEATVQTQRERLTNFPLLGGAERTISDVTVTDVAGNSTRTTTAVDRAARKTTVTTDAPDSNVNAVSVSINGLVQSSTPATPQAATTFAYDALGRRTGVTDPRAGTTTSAYSATTGQLLSTADAAQTTSYEYYPATHMSAGRVKAQTNSQGKKVYFNHNSRGELTQTWGEATYPLAYVYDAYGQKTELHTYRGGQNWGASAWPTATTGTAGRDEVGVRRGDGTGKAEAGRGGEGRELHV